MNERYVYGYNSMSAENNPWNIENEYINSLSEMLEDYADQMRKIEEINKSIENAEIDIDISIRAQEERTNYFINEARTELERNNSVTYPTFSDEQIKMWYEEDYPTYNTSVTFEAYKANLLKELEVSNNLKRENLNRRNQELLGLIEEKQNYLSQLKTKKQEYLTSFIPNKKNELVANQYLLINIKQETKKSILKRKNEFNLLLSEKRIELSSILLEQQRLKPERDERGNILNSEELLSLRNRYDSIWLEIRKLEHALQKTDEILKSIEYTQDETSLMMRGLNPNQKEIYNNIIAGDIKVDEPVEKIEPESQVTEITEGNVVDASDKTSTEKEIKSSKIQKIIEKVCDDISVTKGQSSRYAATKIKLFKKPEISNLGFSGKIKSIAKAVIGIIPRAALKFYGNLIDNETLEKFQDMEYNAMDLTDEEVITLLDEYNDNLESIPPGFEESVKPRVNSYVSKRVDYLTKSFNESMFQIALSQKEISECEDKEKMESAYVSGCASIKGLIKIQIEVEKLLSVSNLHSFESQLKSLDNKLVYAGGRFERAKEYDTSLWSKVSGLSQKIEYSLDPKEVVDSYTEREKIYKEYGKHKSFLSEGDLEKLNSSEGSKKVEKEELPRNIEEIRSLIEGLKSMKAELSEQDVKEIEGLLR